jgi:hypothetical protein
LAFGRPISSIVGPLFGLAKPEFYQRAVEPLLSNKRLLIKNLVDYVSKMRLLVAGHQQLACKNTIL